MVDFSAVELSAVNLSVRDVSAMNFCRHTPKYVGFCQNRFNLKNVMLSFFFYNSTILTSLRSCYLTSYY